MTPNKRILLTGICGFVGHHFAEHILHNTDWQIVGIDRLSYASNGFDRLRDAIGFPHHRVLLFAADFTLPFSIGMMKEIGHVDYLIHLGAETHVDNSIRDPQSFVTANVVGTRMMLDYAKQIPGLETFFYFSTDEVFGPAREGVFYKEDDRHKPGNPYAASKSAAEMLCIAEANTYGLPVVITRTMNCFGERQHPEKFIPMVIKKVLAGDKVLIHSDPTKTKAGTRFYIHCRNVAAAYLFLLDKAQKSEEYHIVGEREVSNLQMARFIADCLKKELNYELVDFHSSRPGHDLRYALDGTKMKELGWQISKTFDESLEKTIRWYVDHPKWLNW